MSTPSFGSSVAVICTLAPRQRNYITLGRCIPRNGRFALLLHLVPNPPGLCVFLLPYQLQHLLKPDGALDPNIP